jgi:hypothetical protein
MRLGGFCAVVLVAAASLILAQSGTAHAGAIANWDQSARSWNNSHMTRIKVAMEAAGHRVDADAPITDSSLRATVMVIGEPVATPTALDLGKLRDYLRAGGIILLFGDTGIDLPTYNNLLTGIGSSIQFTTTTVSTSSAITDRPFAQNPTRIVGLTLSVTSGNGTSGGTLIDNNYVRYEQIGSGYVFVFGDRIDHNDVISTTNTTLLLNIVSAAVDPAELIPTLSPALLAAVSLLLAAFASIRLARSRQPVGRGRETRHGSVRTRS